jgi:hypothetical protein
MVDAFRSMLDELMGKERDVPLGKRQNKALEFDDKDVCKYELVGLCPNRLFRNTKSDLGGEQQQISRTFHCLLSSTGLTPLLSPLFVLQAAVGMRYMTTT